MFSPFCYPFFSKKENLPFWAVQYPRYNRNWCFLVVNSHSYTVTIILQKRIFAGYQRLRRSSCFSCNYSSNLKIRKNVVIFDWISFYMNGGVPELCVVLLYLCWVFLTHLHNRVSLKKVAQPIILNGSVGKQLQNIMRWHEFYKANFFNWNQLNARRCSLQEQIYCPRV